MKFENVISKTVQAKYVTTCIKAFTRRIRMKFQKLATHAMPNHMNDNNNIQQNMQTVLLSLRFCIAHHLLLDFDMNAQIPQRSFHRGHLLVVCLTGV